jgi:hypothetical protein
MTMTKYNKAIGTVVGGIVGIALIAFGISDTGVVPVEYQPMLDSVVLLISGVLGTVLSPKNAA